MCIHYDFITYYCTSEVMMINYNKLNKVHTYTRSHRNRGEFVEADSRFFFSLYAVIQCVLRVLPETTINIK